MDSLVFHIEAGKAGPNLAESIRAYFGDRRVQIIVRPELTANDIITQNQAADHDFTLTTKSPALPVRSIGMNRLI